LQSQICAVSGMASAWASVGTMAPSPSKIAPASRLFRNDQLLVDAARHPLRS
jgi:hypothetical protein